MQPPRYDGPPTASDSLPPEAYPASDAGRYTPGAGYIANDAIGKSEKSSKAHEAAAEAAAAQNAHFMSPDSLPAEAYPTSDAATHSHHGPPVTDAKGYIAPSGSQLPPSHSSNSIPSAAYPMSDSGGSRAGAMPTVADPFNFPTTEALPAYSPAAPLAQEPGQPLALTSKAPPIAIPQTHASSSAPFLDAYPECLLARGITEETWRSFMKAMSAFLTAKVSDRAISHAGDMAKRLGEGPKRLGKDIASHSKSIGKQIVRHAKDKNIFGVAGSAIAGIVTIPIFAALGTAGTVAGLPNAAISAVSRKPRTPEARAFAYAAVANEKWLHARGLHAQLVDTHLLAQILGMPTQQLLQVAKGGKHDSAIGQMKALEMHLESVKLLENTILDLVDKTLWLMVLQDPEQLDEAAAE